MGSPGLVKIVTITQCDMCPGNTSSGDINIFSVDISQVKLIVKLGSRA